MNDKNSPSGKALSTAYQTLLGVVPLLATVLSVPELREAANGTTAWSVAIIPVLAAVVAYLQNKKGL